MIRAVEMRARSGAGSAGGGAASALLRVSMCISCSVHAYSIIIHVFFSGSVVFGRFLLVAAGARRAAAITRQRRRKAPNGRQEPDWARKSDEKHVYT